MTRPVPRLLDLFCGGGGSAVGYHRAGFEVVGVDAEPQPSYPFEFHHADAMSYPLDGFDVVTASPPCQDHSTLRSTHAEHGTGWMLRATVERFRASGLPWVVENVPGSESEMAGCVWVTLCGSSFGLRVRRHRRFASSLLLLVPECQHKVQGRPLGVYGSGGSRTPEAIARGGVKGVKATAKEAPAAMGIDWMPHDRLVQAIPPAYTELLGRQLMAHLQ